MSIEYIDRFTVQRLSFFLAQKYTQIPHQILYTLLEKCWRISLCVTDDAIALCNENLRQMERKDRKFSHIELRNIVILAKKYIYMHILSSVKFSTVQYPLLQFELWYIFIFIYVCVHCHKDQRIMSLCMNQVSYNSFKNLKCATFTRTVYVLLYLFTLYRAGQAGKSPFQKECNNDMFVYAVQ